MGWSTPTYATSDYYNVCANANGVGTPTNAAGYQIPVSGVAYCGLMAYSYSTGGCNYTGNYWFEYIQGQFINPLEAGHVYEIGFYVSLADGSNTAVNQIGCYISNAPVSSCNSAPLNFVPQIVSEPGVFIDDASAWVLVSGNYTANGGEKYLTIGNFKDSISTDTILVYDNANPAFSYYYIDGCTTFDVTDNTDNIDQTNVFTPNGDGLNDSFQLVGLGKDEHFFILNRWGDKVFEGDAHNPWNGKDKHGEECSEGTYFYVTELKKKRGFIQLLR